MAIDPNPASAAIKREDPRVRTAIGRRIDHYFGAIHGRDNAPVATHHVDYDDNCPGCSTARCTGDHGTGADHTCGVW